MFVNDSYSIYKKISGIFIFGLIYFLTARLGLLLAYEHSNASPLWPPSGLAFAFMLLEGYALWPAIFLGSLAANGFVFYVNQVGSLPHIMMLSVVIAAGNTLEALAGTYLMKKYEVGTNLLDKYGNVFRFFAITLAIALLSSIPGCITLLTGHVIDSSMFFTILKTWYLGNVSGILIISPLIWVWFKKNRTDSGEKKNYTNIELILNILLILFTCESLFLNLLFPESNYIQSYLIIPLLLWTAFRFEHRTIISMLVLVSLFAVLGTINERGPFYSQSLNYSLLQLESFISIITISFMALRAALTEQRSATNVLLNAQNDLEHRVQSRTTDLDETNKKLRNQLEKVQTLQQEITVVKENYKDACEIAKLGHWQWNVSNNKVSWSEEMFHLFDTDEKQFDASFEGYMQLVYPEDREDINQIIQKAFENHQAFHTLHRIKTPSGKIRWIQGNGKIILNPQGEIEEMRGTALDVTEIKEKEVLSSQLLSIIEHSVDAIVSKTLEGIVLSWNKSAERIFGFTEEETIGKHISLIFPQDRLAEESDIISKIRQGEIISYFETVRKRKDGKLIDVSLTNSPLIDGRGTIIGVSTIARDITQQKQKDDARFKLIVDSAPNAMVLVAKDGKIEIINSQAERLFGYSRQELIGKSIEILLPGRFRNVHPQHRDNFYKHPEARSMGAGRDLYALHKNGNEIPVEIGLNPIETPEGMMVLAAIIDISERKKMEETKREKQVAEESVKMKDQFMANMSHEIRTPMNAIIGFTDLLSRTPLDEEQKQFVKAVKTSGENLLTIINDILDFSKIEAGKMEIESAPISIGSILDSLYEIMQVRATEKNLQLNLIYNRERDYLVMGDSIRLTQILMNLLSNAIKFTEHGNVSLAAKVLEENDKNLLIEFKVSDTGSGIEKEKLKNIFERFTQARSDTSRKYGGTGLGLSIAKNLVDIQGGAIDVESDINKGSTFTVTLPYKKVSKADFMLSEKTPKTSLNSFTGKDIHLLLVEDNKMNQMLALAVLEKTGIHADLANNGQEAIEKVEKSTYDIILMDMQMPEMDGYEATTYIRKKLKNNTPIIAMTAHALAGEREKCLSMGMNDYISKPFKVEELLQKIYSCLNPTEGGVADEIFISEHIEEIISVINLDYLKTVTGNDEGVIREMIDIFKVQIKEELSELSDALKKQDWKDIAGIAHKMKSTVSLMGMENAKNILSDMGIQAKKQENIALLESYFIRIQEDCEKALTELN